MSIDDFLLNHIIAPWESSSDFDTAGVLMASLILAFVVLDAIVIIINKTDSLHYNRFVFVIAVVIFSSFFVFLYWYFALPLYLLFIWFLLLIERRTAQKTLYFLQKGVKGFRIDDLLHSGAFKDSLKCFNPKYDEYKFLLLPKKWKTILFVFSPILLIILLIAFGLRFVFF